jgi:hypothetical protein
VAEMPDTWLMGLTLTRDSRTGDEIVRVSGIEYDVVSATQHGVVYDLHGGRWVRQPITSALVVAGLDGDWAVAWGGRQAYRVDENGTWTTMLADASTLLFDVQQTRDSVLVAGIRGLLKFDGTDWSQVEGVQGGLSIDLVSEEDGWLVGGHNLDRLHNGIWSSVALPGGQAEEFLAVDALSPQQAWFAGNGVEPNTGSLRQWHDGGWQAVFPDTNSLWGLDMLSPAEGWAVGGSSGGTGPCDVMRFVEGNWQRQADVCTGRLNAVEVDRAGTTWAAGYRINPDSHRSGFVLRYAAAATPTPTATTPAPVTETPTATDERGHHLWLPWGQKSTR